MHADIVSIMELSDRDVALWRELAAASVEPNPFVEPDFVLPAMRAYGDERVGILRVIDASAWLAAVPVRRVSSWRGVPGSILVAWRHPYCYLSDPLLAPGDVEAVVSALLARGHRETGSFGLEWIAADGRFDSALRSKPRIVEISRFDRAALYGERADAHGHSPSGRTARKFRQKRRLLEREVGPLSICDRSDDRRAYERFLQIEAAGWRGWGGTGTAMACIPGHAEFFTDMCARFASLGRLRLRALEGDGRVLAIGSDLIAGDRLYFFKQAFDERYARYSPGAQLELGNIEAFRSGGWRMFDSCASPDNITYNKLWPGRRTLRTLIATGSDHSGTLSYAKWRAAIALAPLKRRLTHARAAVGSRASTDRSARGSGA